MKQLFKIFTLFAVFLIKDLYAQNLNPILLQENIYVHFNKPYFYKNEQVNYKAYMLYADQSFKDSLSSVLNVDLLKSDFSKIKSFKLDIANNVAEGNFNLDTTFVKLRSKIDTFYLRFYTKWMRNFGDSTIQYYPIFVLNNSYNAVTSNLNPKKCNYFITKNKPLINETVKLQGTIPNLKSYSITIVDSNFVKSVDTKYQNKIFSEFNGVIEFNYKIEKALSIEGQFSGNRRKINNKEISVVRLKDKAFDVIIPDEKGYFAYFWDSDYETDKLIISKKSFNNDIVFNESTFPISNSKVNLNHFNVENSYKQSEYKIEFDSTSILLNEISIQGEKDIDTFQFPLPYTQPDKVLTADNASFINIGNPLKALQGRIAGVTYLNNGTIDIRGATKSIHPIYPAILINGLYIGNDTEMLNSMVDPFQIVRIEVVKHPVSMYPGSGVINIVTTNKQNKNNNSKDVLEIPLTGFSKLLSFKPNYGNLIWKTDNNPPEGKIEIEFKTKEIPTVYKVELVGILTNGNIVKCITFVNVD